MKCTNCEMISKVNSALNVGRRRRVRPLARTVVQKLQESSVLNAARLLHPIRSHQVLLQKSRPWNFM